MKSISLFLSCSCWILVLSTTANTCQAFVLQPSNLATAASLADISTSLSNKRQNIFLPDQHLASRRQACSPHAAFLYHKQRRSLRARRIFQRNILFSIFPNRKQAQEKIRSGMRLAKSMTLMMLLSIIFLHHSPTPAMAKSSTAPTATSATTSVQNRNVVITDVVVKGVAIAAVVGTAHRVAKKNKNKKQTDSDTLSTTPVGTTSGHLSSSTSLEEELDEKEVQENMKMIENQIRDAEEKMMSTEIVNTTTGEEEGEEQIEEAPIPKDATGSSRSSLLREANTSILPDTQEDSTLDDTKAVVGIEPLSASASQSTIISDSPIQMTSDGRDAIQNNTKELQAEREHMNQIADPDDETTSSTLLEKKYIEARKPLHDPQEAAERAKKYAAIESVEDRAFQILLDLGMIPDRRL